MTHEEMTATATFAELLMAAFDIAVECVIKGEHLGGRAFVGEEGGLQIWMYGLDERGVA